MIDDFTDEMSDEMSDETSDEMSNDIPDETADGTKNSLTICHLLTNSTNPYKLYIKLNSLLMHGVSRTHNIDAIDLLLRIGDRGEILKKYDDTIREWINKNKYLRALIERVDRSLKIMLLFRNSHFNLTSLDIIELCIPKLPEKVEKRVDVYNEVCSAFNLVAAMLKDNDTTFIDSIDIRVDRQKLLLTHVKWGQLDRCERKLSEFSEKYPKHINKINEYVSHIKVTKSDDIKIKTVCAELLTLLMIPECIAHYFSYLDEAVSIRIDGVMTTQHGDVSMLGILSQAVHKQDINIIHDAIRAIDVIHEIRSIYSRMDFIDDIEERKNKLKKIVKVSDDSSYHFRLNPRYVLYTDDVESIIQQSKPCAFNESIRFFHEKSNGAKINGLCDVIDRALNNAFPNSFITTAEGIDLSELHFLFMVDKYPADSIFDINSDVMYVCRRVLDRFKSLGNVNVTSRVITADQNVKASIMRNVACGYAYTTFLWFNDDDDFSCSVPEICDVINEERDNVKAVYSITASSVRRVNGLCGMWRFLLRTHFARVLCFNNPPYIMQGEDVITTGFYHLYVDILGNIVDMDVETILPHIRGDDYEKDDTCVCYMYMEASNRYNDKNIMLIEKDVFRASMRYLLGLKKTDEEIFEQTHRVRGGMRCRRKKDNTTECIPPHLRGIDIDDYERRLRENVELFDTVYAFHTFSDVHDRVAKPFYSFAAQRPTEAEIEEYKKRLPEAVKVVPRKAVLNRDTGEVSYDEQTYTVKEWNDYLGTVIKSSYEDYRRQMQVNLAAGINKYEGVDITKPRVQVFGGDTSNRTIIIFISCILLALIIVVIVCIVLRSRSRNVNEPSTRNDQ